MKVNDTEDKQQQQQQQQHEQQQQQQQQQEQAEKISPPQSVGWTIRSTSPTIDVLSEVNIIRFLNIYQFV
ncbi:hypothetical protein KIN20_015772 [Parelaphostrongylus tenuis]|uniref:Uncharacterized protein n=1 Tax=Parelaphostrongylus tenuis TaxID=148309 RepID=A0AAD5QQ50_PARTN|nr:hypothetical protein KIN20_015772 [Parelaphostrongylus tenuis]